MKASIVIPCYNAEMYVGSCLKLLLGQLRDDYEVLILDDASSDGTIDKLNKYKPYSNFRIFQNKVNLGPGASRNILIKNSKGEIILFLDIDCIVPQDWVSLHLSYQQLGYPIVGGAIKGIYQSLWGKIDDYSSWFTSIPNSGSYFVKGIHLPTTNLSIRKDVFKKIGYFREDVSTGEDANWCHRAEMKQFKLFFTSRIVVRHFNRDKLEEVLLHEKSFGNHALKVRANTKMPYNWVIPKNIYFAILLALPIALCYSAKVTMHWCRRRHNILPYFVFIFFIKMGYSLGLISGCFHEKKWKF